MAAPSYRRAPLPIEYDAEPVPATRPLPVQQAPQQMPSAPQRVPAAPQRRPVGAGTAGTTAVASAPLVITRPVPVQVPREVAQAPRVSTRPRRAPRSAKRAMQQAVRTGPVPTVGAPAAPANPRHIGRSLLAMLGVCGLTLVMGLPGFAADVTTAPPPSGAYADGDTQAFQAGGEVQTTDPKNVGAWDTVDAPNWISPVVGRLGDPFGPRPIQPVPGVSLFHRGQDIVAACGTEIHAAAAGVVAEAMWWGTYGNWILIDDGSGVATGYAHEERMLVSVGQHVQAGQVIGLVGETGAATGCHLHLEVHINGVAINPVPFFTAKGVQLGS